MNDARKELGQQLRRLRLDAGKTQWAVARRLGYSTAQFISNWERGLSVPPTSAIRPLAEAFGVKPRELVDMIYVAIEAQVRIEKAVVLKELRV